MAYVLVPDGFSLEKVTKLQKDAVDRYYRHENVNTLLENPSTVPFVASAITAVVGGILLDRFLEDLDLPQTPDIDRKVEAAKKKTLKLAQGGFLGAGVDVGSGLLEQFEKLIPDVKLPRDLEGFGSKGLA
tara:strand:+ start:1050 stop:1439 length:390 start_codon:yes stop_codon:yes gene_type:complete